MKYHYIPQYDEFEFNRIANETDPVLQDHRRIQQMRDIIARRRKVLNRVYELENKYRPTPSEAEELQQLRAEAKKLMRQVSELSKLNKNF